MLIPSQNLRVLIADIFKKTECSSEEAEIIAEHLVEANLVGHDSHGVIRTSHYIKWLGENKVFANQHVTTIIQNESYAVLDGNFGFGQVLGREAVNIGIQMARANGISVVGLRNSGHLGRIGDWAIMAADAGLISLHFVNGNGFAILAAPYGGSDKRLSSNPICIGVPRGNKPALILDMATCKVSQGKIMVAKNKGEMLPAGMVIDAAGKPSRDPNVLFGENTGAILPLDPGYKGFGLSLMCELLAGAMIGGDTSHPKSPTADKVGNGMLSVYIDREKFCDNQVYLAEIDKLVDWVTASPPVNEQTEILLPGEPEVRTKNLRLKDGIPLDQDTINQVLQTAKSVGLPEDQLSILNSK